MISAQSVFISGDITICSAPTDTAKIKVSFNYGTPPYSFVYAINGVNQESITTDDNPYYIKTKEAGTYTISYFSDAISNGIINGSAEVTVLDSPNAMFSTDADTMSILYTTLKLQDLSEGNIIDWQWDFGDGNTSSQENPYHTYQSFSGIYQIKLIVTDDMYCIDTAIKKIWVSDTIISYTSSDYWMYIPNSFTPDNDGLNDRFCIKFHGIRDRFFLFKVFNDQGDLIYQSINPDNLRCGDNGWDGKHFITKEKLPADNYVYEMYFQDSAGRLEA